MKGSFGNHETLPIWLPVLENSVRCYQSMQFLHNHVAGFPGSGCITDHHSPPQSIRYKKIKLKLLQTTTWYLWKALRLIFLAMCPLVMARIHISFEILLWNKVSLRISPELDRQLDSAHSATCNKAKTWAQEDWYSSGWRGGRVASAASAGAPPSSHGVLPQWNYRILGKGLVTGQNGSPECRGRWDWPVIPTPCLGVVRTPWAYALGRDLVGERKPRLRCMGYPAAKRQYIIESLNQRCFVSVITTRKTNAYRKSSAN